MPRGMRQIIAMFDLFLGFNSAGLGCFMYSDEPFPSREDIALMMAYSARCNSIDIGRVDGGQSIPEAQGVLESAEVIEGILASFGGLETFRQSFELFRTLETEACQNTKGRVNRYDMLRDICSIGSLRFQSLNAVAIHHHITHSWLIKKRDEALEQIAKDVYFKKRFVG